jgi:predicted nuclease with TOPRIM domain
MLQDEDGETFYLDLWAIEAIARVIRQVDDLGSKYVITLESIEPVIEEQ